jgi:hypothetical protein
MGFLDEITIQLYLMGWTAKGLESFRNYSKEPRTKRTRAVSGGAGMVAANPAYFGSTLCARLLQATKYISHLTYPTYQSILLLQK